MCSYMKEKLVLTTISRAFLADQGFRFFPPLGFNEKITTSKQRVIVPVFYEYLLKTIDLEVLKQSVICC